MRRAIRAVSGAAIVALLTACAPAATDPQHSTSLTSTSAASVNTGVKPTTPAEAGKALSKCLGDKGWDVNAESDGLSAFVPPEQRDHYQEDVDACATDLGLYEPGAPVDAAYAKKQYERTLAFRECLIDEGYAPPQLPSYTAYEEALLIGEEIYDLGYLTGIPSGSAVLETCDDPMLTWGQP